MKAFVLSGGGALGAYEAGVSYALMQREEFDMICGVSIGAINAALLSTGINGTIEHFWREALPSRAPQLFPHVPRLRMVMEQVVSIGHNNPLQDAICIARVASLFPFIRNLGKLQKSALPQIAAELGALVDLSRRRHALLIGATNVTRGNAAVFAAGKFSTQTPLRQAQLASPRIEYRMLNDENFVTVLLASSAMPGVFSPIELEFDGERSLYADGCIIYASPVGLAIDHGATEITVVFVNPAPSDATIGPQPGIAQMAYNVATLWQQRMLDYELRLVQARNELIRLGGDIGNRPLSIRYVRPSAPLELDMLAFDDATGIGRAFDLGMHDGAKSPQPSIAPIPLPEPPSPPRNHWLKRIWQRTA
jgi:predicted acylesterase/phospholipase RssA